MSDFIAKVDKFIGKGKEDEMRAIYKEPGKEPEIRNIDNELGTLQSLVDGWIEHLTFITGVGLIMNEEGKLRNMEPNFRYGHDMVVGPAIFVGEGGEDFTDITDEQAMRVLEFLRWHTV